MQIFMELSSCALISSEVREKAQDIIISTSNAQNLRSAKNGPKYHLLMPDNPAFLFLEENATIVLRLGLKITTKRYLKNVIDWANNPEVNCDALIARLTFLAFKAVFIL